MNEEQQDNGGLDAANISMYHVSSPNEIEYTSNGEKRKVALLTGVTGQDGSYLAEFLLDKVSL